MKAALAAACAARHEAMLEDLAAGKRRCPQCRLTLPIHEFSRNRGEPSGLSSWCRGCLALAARRRYHERNRLRREQRRRLAAIQAGGRKGGSTRGAALHREMLARIASGVKTCPRCHRTLARTEFNRSSSSADGLAPMCAACNRELCLRRYYRRRDEARALAREQEEKRAAEAARAAEAEARQAAEEKARLAEAFRQAKAEAQQWLDPPPASADWRKRAACLGMDLELFFPGSCLTGPARKICAGCPVRIECREDAVANGALGIWGGTTGAERALIKRARRLLQPNGSSGR